jgi:hypothetical protein
MTKEEFQAAIKTIFNNYKTYKQFQTFEKKLSDSLRPHDATLADKIENHIKACDDVYEYLFTKVEKPIEK